MDRPGRLYPRRQEQGRKKWAKHGPFSKNCQSVDPLECGSHEYNRIKRDAQGRELRGAVGEPLREPLPPEKMYEALMSLLMRPGVTVRRDSATVPPTVLVDVVAPGFEPGRSSLNVLATVETEYRMSPEQRAVAIQNGFSNVPAMESWTPGAQAPMTLLEWSPLYAEDGMTPIGIRYRYAYPDLPTGGGERRFTIIRARARHITADQLIIPTVPAEEEPREASPFSIDPEIPGWVYAEPVSARR